MANRKIWLLALLGLAVALPLAGCGPKEKSEPGAETQGATPAGPAVNEILALAPEETIVKAAAPSFAHFHDMTLAYGKRFAPKPEAMNAWVRDAAGKVAAYNEIEGADDFVAILEQGGIDVNAPWGVFLDISADSDDVMRDIGRALAGMSGEADAATSQWQATLGLCGAKLMSSLQFAAVFTVSDAETAEAFIRKGYAKQAPPDAEWEERTAAGHTYHNLSTGKLDVCYALTGGSLVVSNPPAFMDAVLAQVDSTAEPLYGTDAFPVVEEGEAVILTRMDRSAALMDAYAAGVEEVNPLLAESVRKQFQTAEGEPIYTSADPSVSTLAMAEDGLTCTTRMRTAEHPKAVEAAGTPGPIEEAAALPANTQSTFVLALTPEMKELIQGNIESSISPEKQDDPTTAQMIAGTQTVLSVLGGEVIVALHDVEGAASASLRAVIANRDMLDFFLLMAMGATEPSETYKGVGIVRPPAQSPTYEMGLCYAYLDDALVLATDDRVLRSQIDAQNDGANWLASLDPPVDPQRPTWVFMTVDGAYLRDTLLPTIENSIPAPIPAESRETIDRVLGAIDSVRMFSGIEGPYMESSLELAMTPAEKEITPAASP